MIKTPVASLHTEGRTFGTDWSIAHVAALLRSNAARGAWSSNGAAGGYAAKINGSYLRTVSARHLPTNVSVIFMRLQVENAWYASLCFAGPDDYLSWNQETADQWLWALFGQDRPLVSEAEPGNASVRQFTLAPAAPISANG